MQSQRQGESVFDQLKHLARLPLWPAELLTGAKSFEDNGIIGSRWLNQRGLHAQRVRLAHRLAQARRERLAGAVRPEDRLAFERDGYVVRRGFLPDPVFRCLVAELQKTPLALREKAEGDSMLRKTSITPQTLRTLPVLARLLQDSDWRALIRYVGARDTDPTVQLQSVLQHAGAGPRDPQTFTHADTFHPTVKAWFYLTDVAADAGPLTYVPGSHRLTPARLAWERRMSLNARHAADADTRQGSFRIDEAGLRELGLPPPQPLAVPANTLIVADTFGFHARGRSAEPSVRVEVWAFGPRNPFLPWTQLDTLVGLAGRPRVAWNRRVGLLFDAA